MNTIVVSPCDVCRIDDDTPGVTISDNGLTISSLRLRDSGVYQCIASSGAGATSDSITISVIGEL